MKRMRAVVTALLLLSLNSLAMPQSFTGVVSGRVLDEQGSYLPNATLRLTNRETGAERTALADEKGTYRFLTIPPGKYSLTASKEGFAEMEVAIDVAVAEDLRADITLKVGTVKTSFDVPATGSVEGSPRIEISSDAQLSNVVTREQIIELPLLTREVYELVNLSPGTAITSEQGNRAGSGIGLSVNGQRSSGGNYVLDGGENNNTFDAGPALRLPADAIKEFRVITNNYTAEYGRNAGFIANVVSNVGTNEFHGSIYNFNRNSALSANSFDRNANNQGKPVFNRNQFGGTIGGPIKKDKLLFLGTVESILIRSTAERKFYVPTNDFLSISSPATRAIFVNDKFNVGDLSRSTTDVIFRSLTPAPGQGTGGARVIPAYAAVSASGPVDVGAGEPQDTILASGRLDYNINSKTQLFGRYSIDDVEKFAPTSQPYSRELDQPFLGRSQNISLNLARVWTNNLVTESRILYNRTLTLSPATDYFPIFFGPIAATLPSGINEDGGVQNLYQFYHTASLARGSHLYKFGGQYIHTRDNRIPPVLALYGPFPFAGIGSDQSLVNGRLDLYQISFDPQGKNPGQNVTLPPKAGSAKRHYRYNEFSLFIQDSWKATPRLTLTPGLRWEYMGVPHSTGHEKDLDANFYYDESKSNIFERYAGGQFFRTSEAPGEYKNHFYLPDYNNFAPRFGLAYDLLGNGSLLFRSGIGMFYDRTFGNQTANIALNPPSYTTQNFGGGFNFSEDFVLRNAFQPIPTNQITLGFVPARHIDQNLRTAYTVSWNAGIERQMARNMIAGITYVGASGVKLYSLSNTNRVNGGTLLGRPRSDDPFSDPNTLLDIEVDGVRFARVLELNTRGNLGHSTYHAMQLRVESGEINPIGLQFWANYTWSHSIDNVSSVFQGLDPVASPIGIGFVDAFNPSLDRGDSDFDIRQRFVTNFVWNIPFGRKSENRFVRNVLAGWGLSGVLSFQTGQPFSIYDSGNPEYQVNFSENPRPRFGGSISTGSLTPDATRPNSFLYLPMNFVRDSQGNCTSTGPFYCSTSVSGPFDGTISRNVFRRPGTQYHNLAVLRSFDLPRMFGREGMSVQLRAEFFNVFNHANLYVEEFTNDVDFAFFNRGTGAGGFIPAVTAKRGVRVGGRSKTSGLPSYIDNRQVVLALKFIF